MGSTGISHICLSAWHRPGSAIFSNEEGVKYTRAFPDRISGRGSVDLHDPVNAVKELKHYVKMSHTCPLCPSEVGEVGRPVPYIDTIALKFPELKIICGYVGWPWAAETSPKYYAPEFLQFAHTTGRRKVIFGTNFPQLGWKACVDNVQTPLVDKGVLTHTVVADSWVPKFVL
ncbi:hypothetical protein BDV23DRAFT_171518 [Aspergillus alliaceus]|uniref:Amidohydrolase-related domain-containing protein n=1 Tax=Petromyces alliaceus TaxID=209559 RepID=A0A5N7CBL8_PETAA|nr:hypothetical protein BDV23DRAFT_171518 [Aspergillus alliaceus]